MRAIEIHPDRAAVLRDRARRDGLGVTVEERNFLAVPPCGSFDVVVMNPPFVGTHWMAHVRHALDFLKPGGILRAVLPASAEVNEGRQFEAFRAWAKQHSDGGWRGPFFDLPPESFAESGTRIQTVIMRLRKR